VRWSAPEPTARYEIRKRGMAGWSSLFTIESLFDSCSDLKDPPPDLLVVLFLCSLLNAQLYSLSNKV
jgi:hypothetical protein